MVVLALSGSINCVKHLQAIAHESGLDVDVYALFAEVRREGAAAPAIRPNGERRIEEFEPPAGRAP